jgi:hypothetical protein
MGIREEVTGITGKLEQVATDVKWLVEVRKEELSDKKDKKSRLLWLTAIIIPVIVSVGIFSAGMVKNIEILCALHKPQIELFRQGASMTGLSEKGLEATHGKQR